MDDQRVADQQQPELSDVAGSYGRRVRRLVAAAALVLIAAVELLTALRSTTSSYLTPGPPGRLPDQHTVVSATGVAAAITAVLAVVVTTAWLVWNVRGRPPHRPWWAVAGLVLVVGVWVAIGPADTATY